MNRSLPSLFVLCYLFISGPIAGQEEYSLHSALTEGIFNPTTPEVATMEKYGNTELSLFTGRICPEIPLYVYKDNDFEIPIKLTYNCNGFKPGMADGITGYGWGLNAGGAITREVRGLPDEAMWRTYRSKSHGDHTLQDMLHILSALDSVDTYTISQVMRQFSFMKSVNVDGYAAVHDSSYAVGGYDVAYTGEFANDYMLTRVALPDSVYHHVETEPDIYHFSFPGYSGSFILLPNHRVLVTESSTPAGEISVEYQWNRSQPLAGTFIISTGDGTVYTFGCREEIDSYDPASSGDHEDRHLISAWKLTSIQTQAGRTAQLNYEEYYCEEDISYLPYLTIDHVTMEQDGTFKKLWLQGEDPYLMDIGTLVNTNQDKYLKSIVIDGRADISFSYGRVSNGEPLLLEGVSVRNMDSTVVRSCSLSYARLSQSGTYNILRSVHVSGQGTFSMSYYGEGGPVPARNTPATDWYGYYSGSSSWHVSQHYNTNDLLSCAQYMKYARHSYNTDCSRIGMLRSITYPTGGKTSFTYEQNTYGRMFSTNQAPTSGTPTGGLRIHSVQDYDSDGRMIRIRSYQYEMEDGACSGVLLQAPSVYYKYKIEALYFNILRECVTSSSGVGFSKDSHIEYPRVVETVSGDGKTAVNEYRYVSGTYGRFTEQYSSAASSPIENHQWLFSYQNMGSESNEGENHRSSPLKGRLASERNYSGSISPGSLIRKREYTYHTYPFHFTDALFLTFNAVLGARFVNRDVSTSSAYTFLESEIEYDGYGRPITEIQKMQRVNPLGRTGRLSHVDSEGRTVTDTITYHPSRPAFITESRRLTGGLVSSATRYDYDSLLVGNHTPILPVQISEGRIQGGVLYGFTPTLHIDTYDSWGNPTRTRNAVGDAIDWQWGYSGQYLTRKSEGGLITTWTWIPLVGVSSVTQPNGSTTTYEYDDVGRLKAVYDTAGNKLEQYFYNVSSDNNSGVGL